MFCSSTAVRIVTICDEPKPQKTTQHFKLVLPLTLMIIHTHTHTQKLVTNASTGYRLIFHETPHITIYLLHLETKSNNFLQYFMLFQLKCQAKPNATV